MNTFKFIKINLFIATLALFFFSCNKTKVRSNRLTGETWVTESITIDGQAFEPLPTFTFDKCAIYDEICFGALQTSDESVANFAWQIREKGTIFELSDQTENKTISNEKAVDFCASFSGNYSITETTKNKLTLESTTTVRHKGKKVLIVLKKK